MENHDRNGGGPASGDDAAARALAAIADAQRASAAGQSLADADQSAADADQTSADADQAASVGDQASAASDQDASDRDQATADRNHNLDPSVTGGEQRAYETSREERERASLGRFSNQLHRSSTAQGRDVTSAGRDRTAGVRDEASRSRDAVDAATTSVPPATTETRASLMKQLEELRAQAADDRAQAAADRARAATDRANAARERDRLEAELRSAHLDELTGAYRREMGLLTLSHEIDRARRSDGRFVVAFVDVDRLKAVNDREGHAAGDRVLQSVVREIRARLRSFDPIVRYGGDEFVCGLGGADLADAERRFASIEDAIETDARVGISVGLAALEEGDTADQLTERADVAMLQIKEVHRSRQ